MNSCAVLIENDSITISLLDDGVEASSFVVPVGITSLHRRHFDADPALPEDLTNAIGEVIDHLDDARRLMPLLDDAGSVVVSGETARVIAAVEHGGYIHTDAFELTRDAAEDVFRTLALEASAERRHNPGLPTELADTIVAGCCVMVALFRCLHLDTVSIAIAAPPLTTTTTGSASV